VVGGQRHVSAALPQGNTRYPLYRRLFGPQGRSGRVQKILPPCIHVHIHIHTHKYVVHTHIHNAITNRILLQHMFARYDSKYIRLHPTNAYTHVGPAQVLCTSHCRYQMEVTGLDDTQRNKLSVTITRL